MGLLVRDFGLGQRTGGRDAPCPLSRLTSSPWSLRLAGGLAPVHPAWRGKDQKDTCRPCDPRHPAPCRRTRPSRAPHETPHKYPRHWWGLSRSPLTPATTAAAGRRRKRCISACLCIVCPTVRKRRERVLTTHIEECDGLWEGPRGGAPCADRGPDGGGSRSPGADTALGKRLSPAPWSARAASWRAREATGGKHGPAGSAASGTRTARRRRDDLRKEESPRR